MTQTQTYTITFPTPHGRPGASTKKMIAWGYYDWAADAIARKYGISVESDKSSCGSRYIVKIPEHFAVTAFFEKLKRLYQISWY